MFLQRSEAPSNTRRLPLKKEYVQYVAVLTVLYAACVQEATAALSQSFRSDVFSQQLRTDP